MIVETTSDFFRAVTGAGGSKPEDDASEAESAPPPGAFDVQRLRGIEDLEKIQFFGGMAAVEAPIEVVREIRFKNHIRRNSPRLRAVVSSVARHGYRPDTPIIVRIGQKGRWIIVDGGHRLTAALKIDGDIWHNLLGRKVNTVYFLLFETERSWRKMKTRVAPELDDPEEEIDPDRVDPSTRLN